MYPDLMSYACYTLPLIFLILSHGFFFFGQDFDVLEPKLALSNPLQFSSGDPSDSAFRGNLKSRPHDDHCVLNLPGSLGYVGKAFTPPFSLLTLAHILVISYSCSRQVGVSNPPPMQQVFSTKFLSGATQQRHPQTLKTFQVSLWFCVRLPS